MAKVLTTIVHYDSGYPPFEILLCSGCEQRTILHGESYVALIEDGKRVGVYPPACAPLTPDGLARICERHPKWTAPAPYPAVAILPGMGVTFHEVPIPDAAPPQEPEAERADSRLNGADDVEPEAG